MHFNIIFIKFKFKHNYIGSNCALVSCFMSTVLTKMCVCSKAERLCLFCAYKLKASTAITAITVGQSESKLNVQFGLIKCSAFVNRERNVC